MDMSITRRRLCAWSGLLTADHMARGKTWYANAHAFAEAVSAKYSVPLDRVVGVLACLSVQNRWDTNRRDCETLIRANRDGIDIALVSVGTYPIQKAKAIAILHSVADAQIADMIAGHYGPKTKAFYDNILSPSTSIRVTIDRWILRGLDLEAVRGGNGYVALYRHLEGLFREEANRQGMRPCEYQAAVWCCVQSVADAESWDGVQPGTGLPPVEEPPF
jgi:hypothetical protein